MPYEQESLYNLFEKTIEKFEKLEIKYGLDGTASLILRRRFTYLYECIILDEPFIIPAMKALLKGYIKKE